MKDWTKLPPKETIEKVMQHLNERNFNAVLATSEEDAKQKALDLIPKGSEVLTATSKTLEIIGITASINTTDSYVSIRNELVKMNRQTQSSQMQKLGSAPDYIIGSVHAITEDGIVFIASNTGSQLPGYSYGASHVIWVVGAQKIVKDMNEALERINTYALEKEDERALQAYGIHSEVKKILIMEKEANPNRIHTILLQENIGF